MKTRFKLLDEALKHLGLTPQEAIEYLSQKIGKQAFTDTPRYDEVEILHYPKDNQVYPVEEILIMPEETPVIYDFEDNSENLCRDEVLHSLLVDN